MDQWSIAMDTTLRTPYQYLHHSHLYLSDPPTHHIEKWPEFVSRTQTSPRWQLKLPDLSTRTTKIPSKYQHPLSSQRMKGLPRGWAYVKDNEEGKHKDQYGHLPPQLTHAQQQHEWWRQLDHPKVSSTTSVKTSFPSPSPTSTESPPQLISSKFT